MRGKLAALFLGLSLAAGNIAFSQSRLNLPKSVTAGEAFSISTTGGGKATLFIIGPGQVLERSVQLGETTYFPPGSLYYAGHYLAFLTTESSSDAGELDVTPQAQPVNLSFLARPSRLQVGLHNGITGAVYLFDAYRNLITFPTTVHFELSTPSGKMQTRTVIGHNGAAWIQMDSTEQQGIDKFVARADGIASTRIVAQVPGDPCGLKITARRSGRQIQLETDPVRDCSGNAVPDGTIVTFTETYDRAQSTVDVPLKRGIAKVEMPAHEGATVSVASGVVLGNQIHVGR